ncbi:MAG: sulfopyruvate decarboxylase subunit beta [Methanosphaera sp.]|uniref:sulfopyruvate decarboxylase subunit beta n=1 Tax=Methanosphaera sp. TaxID=2666342 RepID=UPI0025F83905|nr:sulfopyruvate decarboxylase subunit beta [Methanosphaera sp.]MCI5867027.1 sulfopyruvate decarboxylase subunit beta [Methanosphaera sp.]MDD6533970.1 sulfopyruvate decarboxylase subunit beta [Methanosphaera sp.]MDY3956220.1 sulfopyruvate decarboxylase subunit beta [Methanosphaera sp.]
MQRYDAIKKIVETVDDEFIVSNIGFPSRELFGIKDRKQTFYMSGSMGMATPIGLGVALALEENDDDRKVIVIDGDGSLLMNFGELVTVFSQDPSNLIIALIDNEAYGSTGSQKTYASNINLSSIAESIGFNEVYYIDARNSTDDIDMTNYIDKKGPVFIHIKVEPGNSKAPIIDLTPSQIKNRFMDEIKKQ